MLPTPAHERLAYRPAEAAEAIGVSRATFYKLLTSGEVPSVKIGRSRRVRRAALDDYLTQLEQSTRDEAV